MPAEVLPELTIVWPKGWPEVANTSDFVVRDTPSFVIKPKQLVIFVSAPLTIGDPSQNIRRACFAGDGILRRGHIPFIPHLFHLWDLISPKSWEKWLEIDLAILERCDALLRLPGESKGADREVAEAKRLCRIIYYRLEDIPCVSITG